nr:MAG TPA: hypothetical protein [Caudoviricetes sp.]
MTCGSGPSTTSRVVFARRSSSRQSPTPAESSNL